LSKGLAASRGTQNSNPKMNSIFEEKTVHLRTMLILHVDFWRTLNPKLSIAKPAV